MSVSVCVCVCVQFLYVCLSVRLRFLSHRPWHLHRHRLASRLGQGLFVQIFGTGACRLLYGVLQGLKHSCRVLGAQCLRTGSMMEGFEESFAALRFQGFEDWEVRIWAWV